MSDVTTRGDQIFAVKNFDVKCLTSFFNQYYLKMKTLHAKNNPFKSLIPFFLILQLIASQWLSYAE